MIGKDTTIAISKQSIVSLLIVIGLLAMAIPAVALPSFTRAADTGQIDGTFTLGNTAPTVDNVTLWTTGDNASATTAMTPQVVYNIKVTVTDLNQLKDLTTITVTLFYSDNGTYTSGDETGVADNQTRAIFTWAYSDNWSIDSSMSGGSWSIVSDNCVQPNLEASSGTFEFHFIPGKVATQTTGDSKWHIHVLADDGKDNGTGTFVLENRTMNWYGEISSTTGSVSWSNVTAGMDFTDEAAKQTGIQLKYISNGAYLEQVAASDNWSGAVLNTAGTPAANQFSLKANYTDNLTGAVFVEGYETYVNINDSGTQTDESGVTVDTNALYLKLGSPFAYGSYSGKVYFKISNN